MGQQFLGVAILAGVVLGSTVATYAFDRHSPLWWRIPMALCIGLAGLGLVGFGLAMRFGLTAWVVAAAVASLSLPALLLAFAAYRNRLAVDLASAASGIPRAMSEAPRRTAAVALLAVFGTIGLWSIAQRVMFVQPDGIYTGVSHNIGDLPFHLTVTNRFLYGDNFPPEHPSYAGVGFTYPFLTDFLGAMFVRAGVSIRDVMVWSTLLLCVATAALFHQWTLALTGSRDAALVAPAIAFFSGGLGWWRFVAQASQHESGLWALLGRLPRDYTITSDGEFRWGNLITSLVVTQRGLLLGIPLALTVFSLWWPTIDGRHTDASEQQRRMIAAGVIAGMLPLIHAHSFAVVLGMGACIAVLSADRWAWTPFFAWALALGLPQIWWVAQSSGIDSRSFVAWSVGWDRGNQNVVTFWLKNTGLLIPLVITALAWRGTRPIVPKPLLFFYLPFTLCFIAPNLFRLAPWIWDNIKVLVYWFIASVPLVAAVLARLWQARGWRAALAAILFASLTLAGALDLWRVASGAFRSRIFDAEGIAFAEAVAANTEPKALILHAPVPNHPISLTGRRSLMGYPGHVWSHGLDPGPREADIKRMYSGSPEGTDLLHRYGIQYVVVGPTEFLQLLTNDAGFRRYAPVVSAGGHRLYRVDRGQSE